MREKPFFDYEVRKLRHRSVCRLSPLSDGLVLITHQRTYNIPDTVTIPGIGDTIPRIHRNNTVLACRIVKITSQPAHHHRRRVYLEAHGLRPNPANRAQQRKEAEGYIKAVLANSYPIVDDEGTRNDTPPVRRG